MRKPAEDSRTDADLDRLVFSPIDLAKYRVLGPVNPVSGDTTPREFDPAAFAYWQKEWPEAAAVCPSVLDTATREDGFRSKLRVAVRLAPGLVTDLIHRESLVDQADQLRLEEGGLPESMAYVTDMHRFGLEQIVRQILSIDETDYFEAQTLEEVLGDLQAGFPFKVPLHFEPVPDFPFDFPMSEVLLDATRHGAWMLYHYLGSHISVDEKTAAGDFFSALDLSSDLATVYQLRSKFKGRVATRTVLDKKMGLSLPPDDTPEAIRARGESPLFFLAEESSPEFDISFMEVGDTVVFVDGMDGSSAAKFRIPGGASVMVGMGVVTLNARGEKFIDLSSTSILFPGSKALGTESTWYFAEKGKGAYVRRGNCGIESLSVRAFSPEFEDAQLLVNRYGDVSFESEEVRLLQERARKPGYGWSIPSAVTVGLPSSEHGLRVVDPRSGHQVSVSDNGFKKQKVGPWDLVTMLVVREAGGVVQDFDGLEVEIPSPPRPLIFARSQKLADAVRAMVRT